MMYKFLWNVKLWCKGLIIIIMAPFVFLWKLLIDFPIEVAKRFLSESDEK
jgi:hypothetical protein